MNENLRKCKEAVEKGDRADAEVHWMAFLTETEVIKVDDGGVDWTQQLPLDQSSVSPGDTFSIRSCYIVQQDPEWRGTPIQRLLTRIGHDETCSCCGRIIQCGDFGLECGDIFIHMEKCPVDTGREYTMMVYDDPYSEAERFREAVQKRTEKWYTENIIGQLGLGDVDPYPIPGSRPKNGTEIDEEGRKYMGQLDNRERCYGKGPTKKKDDECPDCWGTGLLGGFGVRCPRGCGRNGR